MTNPIYTLEDFREQIRRFRSLGSMRNILAAVPGMEPLLDEMPDIDVDAPMRRIAGIIDAMTRQERLHPDVIDAGRRLRIARGSGTDPSDVDKLLSDFSAMRGLMGPSAATGGAGSRSWVEQWIDDHWLPRRLD